MGRYWDKNYISKNGYSPATNKRVGSITYLFFIAIIWLLFYKLMGLQMLEEPWFYGMHVIALGLVKISLLAIGFWVY